MLNAWRVIKITTIIGLIVSSAGCGFKQRGSFQIPSYLTAVYIYPNDPYEFLQRELRQQLLKNKITIVNQPTAESATLEVSAPIFNKQILARGPSGQVQRFRLSMSTNYKIITKDKQHSTENRSIVRSREVSITNDHLLSNENSEQIIRKELLTETVNELLRQFTRPLHKAAVLDSSSADKNPC